MNASTRQLGIGVIGAHSWAEEAHLPGYAAYDRAKLVAICDTVKERAEVMAHKFSIPRVYTDYRDLLADEQVQMVDVCTPSGTHLDLSLAAIGAGKHVLCEKPLAYNAEQAFHAAHAAKMKRVRTKLGFTFRYSPAMRQLHTWIQDGTLGEIFHVHGFEQNSQFLDPNFPLRQVPEDADPTRLVPSSIIGYGSHLVDFVRWCAGEFDPGAASMNNYIPERLIRGRDGKQQLPIEDGTVALVEFESGAQGLLQSSFVAVGNYPGIELRIYGSKGAAIARLVEEFGIAETLYVATPENVEFKQVELPEESFPPGTDLHTPWPELYYRNLVRHFVDEILDNQPPECTFYDGAKSQQIVDAIVQAHFERRWIALPSDPRSQEVNKS